MNVNFFGFECESFCYSRLDSSITLAKGDNSKGSTITEMREETLVSKANEIEPNQTEVINTLLGVCRMVLSILTIEQLPSSKCPRVESPPL